MGKSPCSFAPPDRRATNQHPGLMSLAHLYHDRVAAQTQHQPLALCDQTHDHTISVLEPQVACARSAYGKAIAALNVRTWEVAEALKSVDFSPRLDLRDADPSNRFYLPSEHRSPSQSQ